MTIAKIAFPGIAGRTYIPEGPYGLAGVGPFPSYDPGEAMDGDKEANYVFVRLGVVGPLTLNQGDVLVWDASFTAVQSNTGAGAHPLGASAGTFYLGGRVPPETVAGGPYAVPVFSYTFPLTGVYGVWVQRYGASLVKAASTAAVGAAWHTTATLGQIDTPALTGSMGISQGWVMPNTFTFTATTATGSNTLTSVSTNQSLTIGQSLSGAGIPAGAWIADIQGPSVMMSANATASASGVTITAKDLATVGNTTSGSPIVTGVPNLPIIFPNQTIAGTGIPAATTILSIGGQAGNYTLTLSANATATGSAVALTASGYVQAMLKGPYIGVQN
jgi:hypothetical protein